MSKTLSAGSSYAGTSPIPDDPPYLRPSITLSTGETFCADVIIGADGSQSVVRPVVEQSSTISLSDEYGASGLLPELVAYTGSIPMEAMMSDEITREVVAMRSPYWVGDGVWVVSEPNEIVVVLVTFAHIHTRARLSHGMPSDF